MLEVEALCGVLSVSESRGKGLYVPTSKARAGEGQVAVAAGVQELETGWMTIGQAAYLLGTSRQILYRRLKNKEIRAALVGRDVAGGRGAWIVSKPDLYRYARENGIHVGEERWRA